MYYSEQQDIDGQQPQSVSEPEPESPVRSAARAVTRTRILAGLTAGAFVITAVGCGDSPTPTLTSFV